MIHPELDRQVGRNIGVLQKRVSSSFVFSIYIYIYIYIYILPVDSPTLMFELSKEDNIGVFNEHLSNDVASGEMPTLIDTPDGWTKVTPVITPNCSSVDDLALLLVDLTEGQTSRDLTLSLPSQEFSSGVYTQ